MGGGTDGAVGCWLGSPGFVTRQSVSARSFGHGPHAGAPVLQLAADLAAGRAALEDVPLDAVEVGGVLWSLSNRRLEEPRSS